MRIAVLTGGACAERAVAIASAKPMVDALRAVGHEVTVVDTGGGVVTSEAEPAFLQPSPGSAPPQTGALLRREREMYLGGLADLAPVREADIVCVALHGGRGEDGTLQGLLDVLEKPYTGSGRVASALAWDKDLAKRLFQSFDIPVPRWHMGRVTADLAATLGWPLIVKPSKQGSTVGLTLVDHAAQLASAYELAALHDDEIMVEEFIPGREFTVPVLDGEALPVGEIVPRHRIFDYECKYVPGMAEETFPAAVDDETRRRLESFALVVHRGLKLGGYSRIDFRMNPEGDIFCLEANTLPGMTATSLVPQGARAAGISFPELCDRICRLAHHQPGARNLG